MTAPVRLKSDHGFRATPQPPVLSFSRESATSRLHGGTRDASAQVLRGARLDSLVKAGRHVPVDHVEWVHQHLDVQLVHIVEESFDPVLVPHVVQQHELDVARRHEGADEVVVELVDALKVRGQG